MAVPIISTAEEYSSAPSGAKPAKTPKVHLPAVVSTQPVPLSKSPVSLRSDLLSVGLSLGLGVPGGREVIMAWDAGTWELIERR